MSDNSGIVNLESLAVTNPSNGDTAFMVDGGDGYTYKYNPCVPFVSNDFYDLAVSTAFWKICFNIQLKIE